MDDQEKLENQTHDSMLIKNVFNMDLEQFKRYRIGVINGLIRFGDAFYLRLGQLLVHADIKNSVKILHAWQQKCIEFEMMYRIYLAKEKSRLERDDHQETEKSPLI